MSLLRKSDYHKNQRKIMLYHQGVARMGVLPHQKRYDTQLSTEPQITSVLTVLEKMQASIPFQQKR